MNTLREMIVSILTIEICYLWSTDRVASWFDHSRDLLVMVNHFADQMPRPIIGVAHSMGCAQMYVSSMCHGES